MIWCLGYNVSYNIDTRCDGVKQCPLGDDELYCDSKCNFFIIEISGYNIRSCLKVEHLMNNTGEMQNCKKLNDP